MAAIVLNGGFIAAGLRLENLVTRITAALKAAKTETDRSDNLQQGSERFGINQGTVQDASSGDLEVHTPADKAAEVSKTLLLRGKSSR